jgi:hypothetical protein
MSTTATGTTTQKGTKRTNDRAKEGDTARKQKAPNKKKQKREERTTSLDTVRAIDSLIGDCNPRAANKKRVEAELRKEYAKHPRASTLENLMKDKTRNEWYFKWHSPAGLGTDRSTTAYVYNDGNGYEYTLRGFSKNPFYIDNKEDVNRIVRLCLWDIQLSIDLKEEEAVEKVEEEPDFRTDVNVFFDRVLRNTGIKLGLYDGNDNLVKHEGGENVRYLRVGTGPDHCHFQVDKRTGILLHSGPESPRGRITDERAWQLLKPSGSGKKRWVFLRYHDEMLSSDPCWKENAKKLKAELAAATKRGGGYRPVIVAVGSL